MNSNRRKLKRRTPSPPPPPHPPQHQHYQIRYDDHDQSHSHRHHQQLQEIKRRSKGENDTSSSSFSGYPTTVIVRNISRDTSQEDLRIPFEKYGPINDVYIPRDYYTGKPKSFGFVKYRNTDDAAEAKYHMNNQIIGGRQISIVFAKEDSKSPEEMNAKAHITFEGRSPPRSTKHFLMTTGTQYLLLRDLIQGFNLLLLEVHILRIKQDQPEKKPSSRIV